jgi:glycosyltransferase involved in cell wall biosynthesis
MTTDRFSNPQISIILTVFNRTSIVVRALNSIFNQSYTDYEIIIINDGSTDDFHEKIIHYLKYDYRIKYFFQSNSGTVASLNKGIDIAEGRFITFLDSDDEYKNNHLESRIDFMTSNAEVDLIHSDAFLVGEEADFWIPDAQNPGQLIHANDCVIGATFFGKREVFKEKYKEVFSYDSEFIQRISGKYNIRKINNPTYIYYRNSPDGFLNRLKNNIKYD